MLGPWWGPTKPFCGYVNEDRVGTVLPGGGTHKHYMWSSKYFPPQVVGTLKPSIEMLLLPLLFVCFPSLPLLPFTPLILPWPCPTGGGDHTFALFTPLCSLFAPFPSPLLPELSWSFPDPAPQVVGTIQPSIEILPIGPHLLPSTKILGLWWGLQSPFAAMWMEIGWALYFKVVGTHKHYMWSSKFFPPQMVGTLKPSIEMLSLPSLPFAPLRSPSLPSFMDSQPTRGVKGVNEPPGETFATWYFSISSIFFCTSSTVLFSAFLWMLNSIVSFLWLILSMYSLHLSSMLFSSRTAVFAGSLHGLQYQTTDSASWLAKKAYPASGMFAHLIQYQYSHRLQHMILTFSSVNTWLHM